DKIYRSFTELAADQAVRTKSARWAFQAVELSRGASWREGLARADVWREKLPPEYWEAVGRLDAAQSRSLQSGIIDESIASLRLKITEMEAAAGLLTVKNPENFRIQTSLNHFQAGIRESEIFLTFLLGRNSSYLWAVSRDTLHVYRLPPGQAIATDVAAFRKALLGGSEKDGLEQGSRLYEDLFGSLNSNERRKKHWLLSLESILFEVPFAALVEKENVDQEKLDREQAESKR